jgi:hypothetical protein
MYSELWIFAVQPAAAFPQVTEFPELNGAFAGSKNHNKIDPFIYSSCHIPPPQVHEHFLQPYLLE